jgi:hypothetical protein
MTKERLKEVIEMLCDADRRGRLTAEQIKACCPTVAEALEVRYGYV